jgi:hypothetical protein
MIRRIFGILTLIVVLSLSNLSVFAADADKIEASKPIITITKPSIDGETVHCNEYTICGITDLENIRVELYKRSSDGSYKEFKAKDEQSAWDVGPSGLFSIVVKLSAGYKNNSGKNIFRIKAIDKTDTEKSDVRSITINYSVIDANKMKPDISKDFPLDKYFKPLK